MLIRAGKNTMRLLFTRSTSQWAGRSAARVNLSLVGFPGATIDIMRIVLTNHLPAVVTYKLPTIGSIDPNTIQNFGGQLTAIARFFPDSNQNFQIA
jgi:hypothetical protein